MIIFFDTARLQSGGLFSFQLIVNESSDYLFKGEYIQLLDDFSTKMKDLLNKLFEPFITMYREKQTHIALEHPM